VDVLSPIVDNLVQDVAPEVVEKDVTHETEGAWAPFAASGLGP
jgi:hypothetical protein